MILLNPKQSSHPNRRHLSVDMGNRLHGMRADDVLISAREIKSYLAKNNPEDLMLYLRDILHILTPEEQRL